MAITRPTGEQLRFRSSKTGEHVLDTYLENAELGNPARTIAEMLGDIFKSSDGYFDPSVFTVRVLTTSNNELQVRVGTQNAFVDSGIEIFNARGTYGTGVQYKVLDIVTKDQDTFVCTVAHTSATTDPASASFLKIVDGSLVKDYANKTDGEVATGQYSAKAWAIGGTGVTDTAGAGAASEWATKTSGTVDGTNYSAKYWATHTDVTTVSSNIADVGTVATNIANVNLTGGVSTGISTLAPISADITTAAGKATDISTVAGVASDVTAVAGITTAVSAVAADATDIGTVATDLTGSNNISAVGGSIANVNTVAGIDGNVTVVANNNTNITAVADINSDVTTVAGVSSHIPTVAGATTAIGQVGGSIANVNTVASNLTNINNFANTYFISASAPASPTTGDLWYDTTNTAMKVYNGTSFVTSTSFANINVADLSDVSSTAATASQTLMYNSTNSRYEPTSLSINHLSGTSTTGNITIGEPVDEGHASTKKYVDDTVSSLIDGAPAALDTLNELAAAMGDSGTFLNSLLPLAGGTMSGNITMSKKKVIKPVFDQYTESLPSWTTLTFSNASATIGDHVNNARYILNDGGQNYITLPDTDEMPAGTTKTLTVFLKQVTGTSATGHAGVNFVAPTGYTIKWNYGGSMPTIQGSKGKITIYNFILVKGDTNIYASQVFYEN